MSDDAWFWLCLTAISICSLFFAANTYALRDFSRIKLEQILQSRGKGKSFSTLQKHLQELSLICSTLRTGANLVLVLLMAWLTASARGGLQIQIGSFILAFVLAILLVSVVSVAIPSAWARHTGENLLARSLPILLACRKIFWPLIGFMQLVDVIFRRLAGVAEREKADNHFEQEIMEAVQEGQEEGLVDQQERKMIESVIEFRDTTVGEIMTPRTEIAAIDIDSSLEQVKQTIAEHGHSRLPVYEDTVDNIVAMLYAKDLLQFLGQAPQQFQVANIKRQCYFVPESKPLRDLFAEFRHKKLHVAVVLDEYGGTSGLITIEDIIEQVMGQIIDEYEPAEPAPVKRIDGRTVEVDARMRIDELNDELDLDLPESEAYETLGGFLFSSMGRIPTAGEAYRHENQLLTILEASPRQINLVRLEILPAVDEQSPEQPSQVTGS